RFLKRLLKFGVSVIARSLNHFANPRIGSFTTPNRAGSTAGKTGMSMPNGSPGEAMAFRISARLCRGRHPDVMPRSRQSKDLFRCVVKTPPLFRDMQMLKATVFNAF